MTRKEFIWICKVFISIKIFSKDLQKPSFTIKNSSEALRFQRGELNCDQTCLRFTTLFWSGKTQKVYPVLEPRVLIIYPVLDLPLLPRIVLYCIVLYGIVLYCIVLFCIVLYCVPTYWKQRPYLCFTYYLIKWFQDSTLVLPWLCKSFKFFITATSLSYDMQCFSKLTTFYHCG